jgi:hypothetical protein
VNKERRARLEKASGMICDVREIIEDVKIDEEDARDNMPENLQASDRYEQMDEAVNTMDDIISVLEEVESQLDELTQ